LLFDHRLFLLPDWVVHDVIGHVLILFVVVVLDERIVVRFLPRVFPFSHAVARLYRLLYQHDCRLRADAQRVLLLTPSRQVVLMIH
jgi:hypothetical protein